jgi:hypothetical protein
VLYVLSLTFPRAHICTHTLAPFVQPITVQIKKHETEQQTEARMRSYAYFVSQDEEDEWVRTHNKASKRHKDERKRLESTWVSPAECIACPDTRRSWRMCEDPKVDYLDHVLAGGNPSKKQKGTTGGGTTASAVLVKREASAHVGKPHAPSANPDQDSIIQLRKIVDQTFSSNSVLSRERVFAALLKTHIPSRLNRMAAAYHDAMDAPTKDAIDGQLHRWIMEACGNTVRHVRMDHDGMERYLKVLEGNDVNDIFKSIVIDLLLEHGGKVKKQDVMTACERHNCRWSDVLYSKVMREYCVSLRGGLWSLKTGNEEKDRV